MGGVSNAVAQRGNSGGDNRGNALATAPSRENIQGLIKTVAEYRGTFGRLLPPHIDAETFVGIAAGALWKNQDLAAAALASPESFIVALRDCARLGHQPGTDQYALTVRSFEKGGPKKVLGIEQYQGVIERMYRAGAVQAVHAEVVCKDEVFLRRDPAAPVHEVADWLDRNTLVDNLRGAYAYALLEGGAISRVVSMGRSEIERHREVAATTKIWDGPFGSSMWLKTVAHELEKWVPTSAEYRREQARAAAVMADAIRQPDTARSVQPPAAEASVVDGSWSEPPTEAGPAETWPPTQQPGGGA